MPHGKQQIVASSGGRTCQNGIGIDARQSLVYQVLVRLAASECGRIVSAGVPVARFHEDEIRDGNVLFARRPVEIAVEQSARPGTSDGTEMARFDIDRYGPIRWERRGGRGALAGLAVLVKA